LDGRWAAATFTSCPFPTEQNHQDFGKTGIFEAWLVQTARIFAAFVGLKIKIDMSIEKFKEELQSSFSFSVRHITLGGSVYNKKPVAGSKC